MNNEEKKRDKKALLYLKMNGITDISQVRKGHREDLYKILDGEKLND